VTAAVYALIVTILACTLLGALILPAPSRAARNEADVHQSLLAAASFMTLITGVLALQDHTAASAFCGAIAWLLVMPCVWLVRGPGPAGEWWETDEDEDDDDGGSPRPHRPSAPPAPDDRLPGWRPSTPAAARPAWAAPRATATASAPAIAVVATATRVQQMLAAAQASEPVAPPVPATAVRAGAVVPALVPAPAPEAPVSAPAPETPCREPVAQRPRVRGDHPSIAYVQTQPDHAGRRRRASIQRGLLRRCRLLLWPAD